MATISVDGDTNAHGGAAFDTGLTTTVKTNGKGIAVVGTSSSANDDLYNANRRSHPTGVAANQVASAGSATVKINGSPVHRVGDARTDGSTSGPGNPLVQVSD
jgi:uncharacterized Zn-binding protein involved in type VI secretion